MAHTLCRFFLSLNDLFSETKLWTLVWSFHTYCFFHLSREMVQHSSWGICLCVSKSSMFWQKRLLFLGALLGLGEKGCCREEEEHAVFPCSLWGHADHSGPASHPAKSPALTRSLTHFGFSHVLTHVPTHYYFFPPPYPWETLWCSSTHSSSHRFSHNPLIKAPMLSLPPKAVSITLLWNPQSDIPRFFNSWNFSPSPSELRVTCQCKYP